MATPRYITEDWLAHNARLVSGSEIRLPADCRLTPAAHDLIKQKRVRVRYTGEDELGQVGSAFNLMADELARHYHLLEQRVTEKTAELQRSNRALELLYHAIARLYQAPSAPDAYEATDATATIKLKYGTE